MYQRTFSAKIPTVPERIFPLLCPVREAEWVPGWKAEVLHSASGVAELGCVFQTHEPTCTWIVHAYDPPRRIGFTIHAPERFAELLVIDLAIDDDGQATAMTWSRAGMPLGDAASIDARYATAEARHARLFEQLADYLESHS